MRDAQADLFEARRLRDDGIERAEEHAERVSARFKERARYVLNLYLAGLEFGDEFTAEDVRVWGRDLVEEPPDRRAWGGVLQRAAKDRRILQVGYRRHKDPVRHCGVSTLWAKA